ncbi:MAG TPA: IS4 family transposase [Dysgonamonadaceae bacterium]|nr:IS4 family transposase [Dysgonamonadaceae bacterium]
MSKSTHFIGQPLLGQLLSFIDHAKVLNISKEHGGEHYVKHFDGWHHLVTMLYAIIMRFDSLREIQASMAVESRKLSHLGLTKIPRRSTLSDANIRRPEEIFGAIYAALYHKYKGVLSSDSRNRRSDPNWFKKLKIMDSTTISLFSNIIFKGVGRNPIKGKKKGGLKVHAIINANEGVPCDVQYTSAATHDHFLLCPSKLNRDDIIALDRAYIDYAKFEEMTQRGIVYVTKMKRNLVFKVLDDVIYQDRSGKMAFRVQHVVFTKKTKEVIITHHARIITYPDIQKKKLISLLTNDFEMTPEDIIDIYRKRWTIEKLFKQLKQNFPLRYFYGESANAIKIQVWCTLIANLLLMVIKCSVKRSWSFSGLATMIRILLMYYVNYKSILEYPEKDWDVRIEELIRPPNHRSLFD